MPERTSILKWLEGQDAPVSEEDLASYFDVAGKSQRRALEKHLSTMIRDGSLIKDRKNNFGLPHRMDVICGRVLAHPDGYGFLRPDGGGDDLFLPVKEMKCLLHGDHAAVRIARNTRRGKTHANVVEVLERANQTIVGRFYREKHGAFVIPDNKRLHQDVLIAKGDEGNARPGEFVNVRIVSQPNSHMPPMGKVMEVIGDNAMNTDLAVDIAIRASQLPFDWPDELKSELRMLSPAMDNEKCNIRRDLRDLDFVTIDGKSARDFDDALFCEQHGTGWRLHVAIADVCWYVKPESVLDQQAWLRGTSVYFPRRTLPMLPELLSNTLCSLCPEEERLTLNCVLEFDAHGEMLEYHFCRAVIRSRARLIYEQAAAIVAEQDASMRATYKTILPALDQLYELACKLRDHRRTKALIEFSALETEFEFDASGQIKALHPLHRNAAHWLVEECMLAANVAAADYLQRNNMPALYRVHPGPKPEDLQSVRDFLGEFSLRLEGGEQPDTADYSQLMQQVQGRDDQHLIEMVLLRSMPIATYSSDNIGHFGLGFATYTHFTSPIRRYPDLLIHRAICHLLAGGKAHDFSYDQNFMRDAGTHCSMTERRAEECVRDAIQRLKCIYLKRHVGDDFSGRITAVTAFGLFIELDDLYVEGLLHVSSLPRDYYHYDSTRHCLHGERHGRNFRLAEPIRVRVAQVAIDSKRIDFELLET